MHRAPGLIRRAAALSEHTTIIRTDYEPTIIVQQDDGRWFRALNWLNDSGIWAALPPTHKAVMWPLHRHRGPDGLMVQPLSLIGREAGLGRSATYEAIQGLLAHPAGLLARHGSVFIVMPGRTFAGRPSATADTPVRGGGRFSAAADDAAPALRAHQNQPTKRQETEIGQDQTGNQRVQARAERELSRMGLVGWPSLSLWGQRAFAAGDAAGVLRDLGAGEGLYGQLDGLADLTVDEVMRRAAEVGADAKAINKPYCLCCRLAAARGVKLERPEIGRARQMGDEWAELARVRVNKRGRA